MSERLSAAELTFALWLSSLDATKVAAEESFHSEQHRFMVAAHERRKEDRDWITKEKEEARKRRIDQMQWANIRFNRLAS
jgi:hypothetical protein